MEGVCCLLDSLCRHFVAFVLFQNGGIGCGSFRASKIPCMVITQNNGVAVKGGFTVGGKIGNGPVNYCRQYAFFISSKTRLIVNSGMKVSRTTLISRYDVEVNDGIGVKKKIYVCAASFRSLSTNIETDGRSAGRQGYTPMSVRRGTFVNTRSVVLGKMAINEGSVINTNSIIAGSVPPGRV